MTIYNAIHFVLKSKRRYDALTGNGDDPKMGKTPIQPPFRIWNAECFRVPPPLLVLVCLLRSWTGNLPCVIEKFLSLYPLTLHPRLPFPPMLPLLLRLTLIPTSKKSRSWRVSQGFRHEEWGGNGWSNAVRTYLKGGIERLSGRFL